MDNANILRDSYLPDSTYCILCQCDCNSSENLELHLNGRKHKRKLVSMHLDCGESSFKCDFCKVVCDGPLNYYKHLTAKRHINTTMDLELQKIRTLRNSDMSYNKATSVVDDSVTRSKNNGVKIVSVENFRGKLKNENTFFNNKLFLVRLNFTASILRKSILKS